MGLEFLKHSLGIKIREVFTEEFFALISLDFSMEYLEHIFLFLYEQGLSIRPNGVVCGVKNVINTLTHGSNGDMAVPIIPVGVASECVKLGGVTFDTTFEGAEEGIFRGDLGRNSGFRSRECTMSKIRGVNVGDSVGIHVFKSDGGIVFAFKGLF